MKRTILTSVLLLAAVITLQAQSFVGKWSTPYDNNGDEAEIIMEFTKDGQFVVTMKQIVRTPEIGEIGFSFVMPGTYVKNGDKKLTVSLNMDNAKADFDYIHFSKQIEDLFKQQPDQKETIEQQLRSAIAGSVKESIGNDPPISGGITIKSVTADTLVIEPDDDDELTLTRIK